MDIIVDMLIDFAALKCLKQGEHWIEQPAHHQFMSYSSYTLF